MGAIPVHLERRIEQRWSSRFRSQTASIASKNVGTKSTLSKLAGRAAATCKQSPPVIRPEGIRLTSDNETTSVKCQPRKQPSAALSKDRGLPMAVIDVSSKAPTGDPKKN